MLDTNVYDELVKNSQVLRKLSTLEKKGAITILKTHVQRDELVATNDESAREALLSVYRALGTQIPTSFFIWDVSAWDESKWDGGANSDVGLDDIVSVSRRHTRDALIATTAACEVDVLVTDDKRLTRRVRAKNPRVQVWSYAELSRYVEAAHREDSIPEGADRELEL